MSGTLKRTQPLSCKLTRQSMSYCDEGMPNCVFFEKQEANEVVVRWERNSQSANLGNGRKMGLGNEFLT